MKKGKQGTLSKKKESVMEVPYPWAVTGPGHQNKAQRIETKQQSQEQKSNLDPNPTPGPSSQSEWAPEPLTGDNPITTICKYKHILVTKLYSIEKRNNSHMPIIINVLDNFELFGNGHYTDIARSCWQIWHRIHMLVNRYGFISVDEIGDLLLKNFEIKFKPESHDFPNWYNFWKYLHAVFTRDMMETPGLRCAVLREVFTTGIPYELYPTHAYLVSPNPKILEDFDKMLERSYKKPLPYNAPVGLEAVLPPEMLNPYKFVELDDRPQFVSDFIKEGCLLRCITVCVKSFDEFYLQVIEELGTFFEFEKYIKLVFESGHFYNRNFVPYDHITQGLYVGVKTDRLDDQKSGVKWFRGQVLKICDNDNKRVLVHLIDYGSWALVDYKWMRLLPKALLLGQPVMAVRCQFEGINESNVEYDLKEHNAELGVLLRSCLLETKAQELVKFCCRSMCPITERPRRQWEIKSTPVHPILQEFLIPNGIISEMVMDTYFNVEYRPVEINAGYDYNEDSMIESWNNECWLVIENYDAVKESRKVQRGFYHKWLKRRKEATTEWIQTFATLEIEEGNDVQKPKTKSKSLADTLVSEEEENDSINPAKMDYVIKVLEEYAARVQAKLEKRGAFGRIEEAQKPRYLY